MLQRRDEMTLELSSSERKDVISHDGRKIGVLVGVNIDTKTWTLKLPRINLKTDLVGVVGDIVHLNVDLKNLKDYI
jgi:hypothetical protein